MLEIALKNGAFTGFTEAGANSNAGWLPGVRDVERRKLEAADALRLPARAVARKIEPQAHELGVRARLAALSAHRLGHRRSRLFDVPVPRGTHHDFPAMFIRIGEVVDGREWRLEPAWRIERVLGHERDAAGSVRRELQALEERTFVLEASDTA